MLKFLLTKSKSQLKLCFKKKIKILKLLKKMFKGSTKIFYILKKRSRKIFTKIGNKDKDLKLKIQRKSFVILSINTIMILPQFRIPTVSI